MAGINQMEQALQRKALDAPDEERSFLDGKGSLKIYKVGGTVIGRGRFEPGWRWSQHVKPIAGTESCQAEHTGIVISGSMCVRMDDGEEVEYRAGDSFHMKPGHDAWVVGQQACELLDFTGVANYALAHQHAGASQALDQTQRNRQVVMEGYEAFARQDIQAILDLYTDDIEWTGYEAANVPFSGSYHGKEEVRQFFIDLGSSMQALQFEPRQVVAEGDHVVVLGHARWNVPSTGREIDSDWAHVFQLRDGRVCRFQDFDDTAQMMQAFGAQMQAGMARPQASGPTLHS